MAQGPLKLHPITRGLHGIFTYGARGPWQQGDRMEAASHGPRGCSQEEEKAQFLRASGHGASRGLCVPAAHPLTAWARWLGTGWKRHALNLPMAQLGRYRGHGRGAGSGRRCIGSGQGRPRLAARLLDRMAAFVLCAPIGRGPLGLAGPGRRAGPTAKKKLAWMEGAGLVAR